MAEKLYLRRPYQQDFRAKVVSDLPTDGGREIILDRTCFYPTSGGQPHDTGHIDQAPVLEVLERDGEIIHRMSDGQVGKLVRGHIDWPRRFDNMQQHTGQHILSQAFEQQLGAHTVAFHLGRETVTIDLDRPSLSNAEVYDTEDVANRVVFQNRPVHSYFVSEEESAGLDLRKLPNRHGAIRIIEVDNFDRIPCGGTHCRRTGEVGLIKILRVDRRGSETRVEFVCGGRALADYRWRNDAVRQAAEALNAAGRDMPNAVSRMLANRETSQHQIEVMRRQLLDYEGAALAAQAMRYGKVDVAQAIFDERSPDEVKWLAQRIVSIRPCIAIMGARTEGKGHLMVARSPGLEVDAGSLLKMALGAVGGRGGGRPEAAQGGAPPDKLEEAILAATRSLTVAG